MTAILNSIGPAVLRATLEASALAIVVAIALKTLGDRLRAEWRFLLWGVVLARLLIVVTPASPWSVFNLVCRERTQPLQSADQPESVPGIGETPMHMTARQRLPHESAHRAGTAGQTPTVVSNPKPLGDPLATPLAASEPTARNAVWAALPWARILVCVWFSGCVAFALRLAALAISLRRRLAAARLVSDAAVLELFETVRQKFGVRRLPPVLVSPEPISPCLVGTMRPKIVLPEAMLTASSEIQLRHVLAHELAHLVRRDLWTNWLLLAARTLHWFNPIAWWTVAEMRTEREAACDEMALTALAESDRTAYATTMLDLASSLLPSKIAPGMIGLFSSKNRLSGRINRLLRAPTIKKLRGPFCAILLIAIALFGLTDAMPAAQVNPLDTTGAEVLHGPSPTPVPSAASGQQATTNQFVIRGRCFDSEDKKPLPGIQVRLFKVEGVGRMPFEVADAKTDAAGHFDFDGLAPPCAYPGPDRLAYYLFTQDENRPTALGGMVDGRPEQQPVEIAMIRQSGTLVGRVVNEQGHPIAGATVTTFPESGRTFAGILSTTTDREGHFALGKLPAYPQEDAQYGIFFEVLHPDYPATDARAGVFSAKVVVTMPTGCTIEGAVIDEVTGKPANGALITADRVGGPPSVYAVSDAAGKFRLVVPGGNYNVTADAKDRVCVAVENRDFPAGKTIRLPPLRLIHGGFITGQIVNTKSGLPMSIDPYNRQRIAIGLYGPSQPSRGRYCSAVAQAIVDADGRFTMRAAPGNNYPYFINTHGDRMMWDTEKQGPVVVKDGETTAYFMFITPGTTSSEKLAAAKRVVAALSADPHDRTAQIIWEFRKLNHTIDETELWCMLMRELVQIGPTAVPQLCAALDKTTGDFEMRRLIFALRAIGDSRAIPALIRAIPKTLVPPSSDFVLIVDDQQLANFMQAHSLEGSVRSHSQYFGFGRPLRENFGALHKLTKQDFGDMQFNFMLSDNPRAAVLQRRLYQRQAERWQSWWEANWQQFHVDSAFAKVNLKPLTEVLPPAVTKLGPHAHLGKKANAVTLLPPRSGGERASHFYNLSTWFAPWWPADVPRDEAKIDFDKLDGWARENDVDLMCTRLSSDGKPQCVLRGFDMKAWEISRRDAETIGTFVAAGKLPEGRPVGPPLRHYDAESKRYIPSMNAAFIVITRDGSIGLLETVGPIAPYGDATQWVDDPNQFGQTVRFDWTPIIP